MSSVGASSPAPRHSPSTTGWPAVSWMVVSRPASFIFCMSHSAAARVSALCSLFALTLGMRRNSNNSSWKRARWVSMYERTVSMSVISRLRGSR
jgi:hypothetical protein